MRGTPFPAPQPEVGRIPLENGEQIKQRLIELERALHDMRIAYEGRLTRVETKIADLIEDNHALSTQIERRLEAVASWFKPVFASVAASVIIGLLLLLSRGAGPVP